MVELRTVTDGDNAFTLMLNGKTVLLHSTQQPCLAIGSGSQTVVSKSGTFTIKESDITKQWLRQYSFDKKTEERLHRGKGVLQSKAADFSCTISFAQQLEMRLSVRTSTSGEQYLDLSFQLHDAAVQSQHSEGGKNSGAPNMFWLRLPAEKWEHIYGCGEQFGKLDLKASRVPVWISEPGVGRNLSLFSIGEAVKAKHIPKWYNTYFSMPSWVSTSGMWCHLHTTAYSEMDFRKKGSTVLHAWEIPSKVTLGRSKGLKGAIGGLSELLGRQRALPKWVYDGMWLGTQSGREITSNNLQKVLAAGVEVGALWCQDWEGIRMTSFGKQLFWGWQYDEELYPDLPAYIQELQQQGVRYLGYINTFLTPRGPMYEEAKANGYLVTDAEGRECLVYVPADPAVLVDFTNPEARAWLKNIIKNNMIEIGLSGWMADFGEYIPHNALLHNGESGLSYHNQYPVDWARLNDEAVEEAGKRGEIVYFMRAGYAGSASYTPAYWNGDQLVDWSRADGLPSAVMGSLSLGASGVGFVHSDIGGYTTASYKKRSKELLMRWAEHAAFTPIMRSHEGNRPDNNWHCWSDEQTLDHLGKMTRVFTKLKPYHLALGTEYETTGIPPIRIPAIHYPDDEKLYNYPYQYMYGRDLFVSPVIKQGKKAWKVRLPKGTWVHIWSKEAYEGGRTVTVDAPLGEPPVFYRAGTPWKTLFEELRTC